MGAQHGVSDIPHAWIRRLDVLDEILLLVQQMQFWRRHVGSDRYGQPAVPAEIEPCTVEAGGAEHEATQRILIANDHIQSSIGLAGTALGERTGIR